MNIAILKVAARSAICLSAAAVVTVTLFSPVVADADERYVQTNVTVGFSDLNLSVPKDAAVLYRRIQKAARHACGGRAPARSLAQQAQFLSCQDMAIAQAVQDVGRNELIAVHRGKLGKKSRHA